jgi:four helix bundle protein
MGSERCLKYNKWETKVPGEIQQDSLWKVEAYRLSLYVSDVGWYDITDLLNDQRTKLLSNQLYRSLGSISANIAEGYSRSSGRDKARFYEYALGSARESRDWYYKSKYVLGGDVISERLNFLTQITRLLIKMITNQRCRMIAEEHEYYNIDPVDEYPEHEGTLDI